MLPLDVIGKILERQTRKPNYKQHANRGHNMIFEIMVIMLFPEYFFFFLETPGKFLTNDKKKFSDITQIHPNNHRMQTKNKI